MTSAPLRSDLLDPVRVTDGTGFTLAGRPTAERSGLDKHQGNQRASSCRDHLADLQARLAAQSTQALLVVFQAMDAAGKDGTIAHVMSGVNPQGVVVTSFKQPGPVELAHDFLWRIHAAVPARGQIGIFNRSHYEEVLTCRVHPDLLDRQHLPPGPRDGAFWRDRFDDIAAFERYLSRQGVAVLKFFLHISADEQRDRLLARTREPDHHWKFNAGDLGERARWADYQRAYEDAIRHTAAPHAPWFVIPADHKWYARLLVTEAIVDALETLDPHYPTLTGQALAELDAARQALSPR